MDRSQRITRDDVRRPHPPATKKWSDRVDSERRNTSSARVTRERPRHDDNAGRSIPKSAHSPERSVSHSAMPPLIKSTSPKLRGSRQSHVSTDGGSGRSQVFRHVSLRTERTMIASSPTGSMISVTSDEVDYYQVVQTDVVPFSAREDEEPGLDQGFPDGDQDETQGTVIVSNMKRLIL